MPHTHDLRVLALHGMGNHKEDFFEVLKARLARKLAAVEVGPDRIHGFRYSQLAQSHQKALWDATRPSVRARLLRKFLLYFVGDPLSYGHRTHANEANYRAIHASLESEIRHVLSLLEPDGKLIIIAQSFGGYVISNFLYDYLKHGRPELPGFLDRLKLIITTGCNIPLFLGGLAPDSIETIFDVTPAATLPATERVDDLNWANIYTRFDMLGWPMRPLGGRYADRVDDIRIAFGPPIANHLSYFKRRRPLAEIARLIEGIAESSR